MTDDAAVSPGDELPHERDLTCEESLAVVYEYLDGELGPERHELVRRHLEKCRECYPYFNFERLFLDYLHEVGGSEASKPGLELRVRELLRRDAD